jgi:regulatory factor X
VHSGAGTRVIGQQSIDPATEYQKQWYEHGHAHERFGSISHHMTPEDMVMQSASQLQNPRDYDIDPSLGVPPNHGLTYPQDTQYKIENGPQSVAIDGYSANYAEGDSQMLEGRSDEQDDVDSQVGAGGPTKKSSKSSAANELEMRQLFQTNKHRSLPEVAMELHGNERGPQSERQRQVFAMLW